jgi:hypothetical protein
MFCPWSAPGIETALTVVAVRTRAVTRQVVVSQTRAREIFRPTEIELTEIEPTEAVDDHTDRQSVGGAKTTVWRRPHPGSVCRTKAVCTAEDECFFYCLS